MPAYYSRTLSDFLVDSDSAVLGCLAKANVKANFLQLESAAIAAWSDEISLLRGVFPEIIKNEPDAASWGLLLEFPIPRRQRRADLILLARDVLFVIEFKKTNADISAIRQVEDYALDLADFHEPSRNIIIFPIVIAPNSSPLNANGHTQSYPVRPVTVCNPGVLGSTILSLYQANTAPMRKRIDLEKWDHGAYHPVPTIVEAAKLIFGGMEVREIAHAASDAFNLTRTVDEIFDLAKEAKQTKRKIICFVTGVPGSGKSLAGLRAVHDAKNSSRVGNGSPLSLWKWTACKHIA